MLLKMKLYELHAFITNIIHTCDWLHDSYVTFC